MTYRDAFAYGYRAAHDDWHAGTTLQELRRYEAVSGQEASPYWLGYQAGLAAVAAWLQRLTAPSGPLTAI